MLHSLIDCFGALVQTRKHILLYRTGRVQYVLYGPVRMYCTATHVVRTYGTVRGCLCRSNVRATRVHFANDVYTYLENSVRTNSVNCETFLNARKLFVILVIFSRVHVQSSLEKNSAITSK